MQRVEWYAGLLAPVRPTVESALRDVSEVWEGDPWAVPRTGLGGALALHVARGFGSSGTRKARRLCVGSIEAWNQRVHRREPVAARALARDTRDFVRAWSRFVRRDDARAQQVIARLVPAWSAEGKVPEAVIFLRGAVAAGVLLGEVADDVHERLDRWATWTALAWEARQGTLDAARWEGALAALGAHAPFPADPEPTARARAHAELAPWADHRTARALGELLSSLPLGPSAPREPEVWEPALAPEPRPSAPRPRDASSALDAFAEQHEAAIERAIEAIGAGAAPRTKGAIEYLRRQGGKRLRPLVVLASTRACGGDPEWPLREAALVEWLHQTSLVIDDVLDGATLRRGGPTLHHATSVPFATGVALQLLSRMASAARELPGDGRVLFAEAAATLAEGEWSEMRHTGDPALSITEYHRIATAKTARLFSTAAALGGLAARAAPAHVRALTRAGHEAGLAFQIVDDLLDLVGDAREIGKHPGTDLRARKATLPILLLRDASQGDERARVVDLVRGARPATDAELAHVRARVKALGIDARCRARARAHLDRALAELERLPDREGAALLAELFGRCAERDR